MSETPWVTAPNDPAPEPPDEPVTKQNYSVLVDEETEPVLKARNDEPPIEVVKTNYDIQGE